MLVCSFGDLPVRWGWQWRWFSLGSACLAKRQNGQQKEETPQGPFLLQSPSSNAPTPWPLNFSPTGEIERERAGDGGLLLRAVPAADCERAFLSAWSFCSRLVFGESSSVGFALRCGGAVPGILAVLWQEKVGAAESVKFDCLLVALCGTVIMRKLKEN